MAAGAEQELKTPSPRSTRANVSTWLPLALWVGVIQGFASDPFAAAHTSRFIGPLLLWLFPDADPETLDFLHFAIRKSCHVVEYGILALLAWRALGRSFALRCRQQALWSLALVVAVAIVDESRQAASDLRGGAVSDVVLDLAGGLVALAGTRWVRRRRNSQQLGVLLKP